ncbi:multiple sugar transport system permease protein [Kaistia soli DSM 19436]|uniref:Multiple sugar transport system permease protein n=1 Tax=Kaistia soli DSM 19436 TaxID=1122133 RepID=A0A1M5I2B2_9HYPH|nr:carbohydrate ABC transporter permease [Kaistia soli]SHG22381.1 multiple sugar transport system permease protein [Kaistia soli DSM 19436]
MIRRDQGAATFFYFLVAGFATVVMLFPLYSMVMTSILTQPQLYRLPPYLLPPQLDLSSYAVAFSDQLKPIITSAIIGALTVAFSLAIAIPAAYGLALFRLWITGVLMLALLITQMIPSIMLATPLYLMFNRAGLTDTYLGLVVATSTSGIPFAVVLLRAFLEKVPKELREAALIDGASEFSVLWRIIIPISRPAIITAGLFIFLFSWADFVYALTLTPTGKIVPLTIGIYKYIGTYSVQWNLIMAASVLASIPAALLLILAQRYVTAGLTVGAVKG